MQKATLIEASILGLSGAVAIILGHDLADHQVNAGIITSTVSCTLAAGIGLASRIGESVRTTLFTCPTKGCTVSIRARGATPAELDRLHDLATDHSRHLAGAR